MKTSLHIPVDCLAYEDMIKKNKRELYFSERVADSFSVMKV